MLRVFLRNQPRYASESHQSGVRNRVDEPVRQLRINPLVLVSPDDERGRVDLAVLVLVEVGAMNRAR